MAALTTDEFRDTMAAAGITPGKPLYAVMVALHEMADGARGLTPDGERALIARVTGAIMTGAEAVGASAYRHSRTRLLVALVAAFGLAMAAGGGLAYLMIPGSQAEVMVGAYCLSHAFDQAGGLVCQLPPVWLRR
ncbi:MAG: hypothetical protein JWP29_1986 [Rhodoferax sp.]|nr:hypothetical protein [Rhodoferax sp.]